MDPLGQEIIQEVAIANKKGGKSRANKKAGRLAVLFAALGIAGFFFLMASLNIFGTKIQYTNFSYMVRSNIPLAWVIGFLYLAMRQMLGKEIAWKFTKSIIITFIGAYIIGFILSLFR